MALPQLTAQQRQAASAKATASRRERAEVKDQLKQSSLSVAEVLALGDRNEVIGAMRVFDLLQSMPGVGKVRATQLMDRLNISTSRRVRGLGAKQRAALVRHARTPTGQILGTPAYMAPEQCRGEPSDDPRIDVYAIGCVLFHLIAGRPPFVGATTGDMLADHLLAPPPPPSTVAPEISPALDELVLRCLAKLPDHRFATMTELTAALAALL